MTLDEALDIIENCLGPDVGEILREGLPDGNYLEWRYDEELVISIGRCCKDWQDRIDKTK